jgi:hypothetical protein
VLGNRLDRTRQRPLTDGSASYAPTPLDYAARRSPWSWRSQLAIWFQLVKIRLTTFLEQFDVLVVLPTAENRRFTT